jgi:MoxR-like ATPase
MLARCNSGFRSVNIEQAGIELVIDLDQISQLRKIVSDVIVEQPVVDYITKLVRKTRENRNLVLGASPRASICLLIGSKAVAAMSGRSYVIPDDIKQLAAPVLRHRLILRPEAEIEGLTPDRVIESTVSEIEVPRI